MRTSIKRFFFSVLSILLVSLVLGVPGFALAQTTSPAPTPTPPSYPKGSINWQTPYARLAAPEFTIFTPNGIFTATGATVRVHSDPGSDRYTTLEATWSEYNVEMRLYIYFAAENGRWRVTELRTYDGRNPGNWIYFDGTALGQPAVGQAFTAQALDIPARDNSGRIVMGNVQLQAFLPTPSPSITPAGYYIEPKPYGTVEFPVSTPNTGYSIAAVVRDSQNQIVTDQSDFSFSWTSQDSNIVTVIGEGLGDPTQCVYGIQAPCPQLWGNMKGIQPGQTTVSVEVRRKSNNQLIASYSFPIRITGNLVGDFNGDGRVNLLDYAILVADFFRAGSGLPTDLNQDGRVNLFDYSILIQRLRT